MGVTNLPELSLLASHQDQVVELPPNATLIASSDFCPIAGFQTGDHFLSFQGHPEFSPEYLGALMKIFVSSMGEEKVELAQKTLHKKVDNELIGGWILNFIKRQHNRRD